MWLFLRAKHATMLPRIFGATHDMSAYDGDGDGDGDGDNDDDNGDDGYGELALGLDFLRWCVVWGIEWRVWAQLFPRFCMVQHGESGRLGGVTAG